VPIRCELSAVVVAESGMTIGGAACISGDSEVLAYVELDERLRMLTNIVDCPGDDVRVGQRVSAVFHDAGEGVALPRLRPIDDHADPVGQDVDNDHGRADDGAETSTR